ncbi:OmpA family protein [Vibrio minamisatsumaniensis]|uniref:OmpA family protein n=1 Tax=Vibrio minamisatsumaniensis TaxID=2910243 RepID=UPI003D25E22E
MRNLVMGAVIISTLPFSFAVNAKDGVSEYCDTAFSEYQHSVIVDDIVGVAQHRQGFLQITQESDNSELKQALQKQSNLGLEQSRCKTWISNQERHGLLARLHFGFDQYNLTPMGNKALNELADSLKVTNSPITVYGHTDKTGSKGYNQALGLKRALTTSDGLVSKGVEKNRIVVRSFGETKPIASNATSEGRAKNRRSEIWSSEEKQ